MWITGYADGEGCFKISVVQEKRRKIGWAVRVFCSIGLNPRDKAVLVKIRNYLEIGKIRESSGSVDWIVENIQEIEILINFFAKYPLITQKHADFLLFRDVFELIKIKAHLTHEGLKQIVAIKASHNLGLSDKLKLAFPNVAPVSRPIVKNKIIQEPQWLAGFTAAEGCFFVNLQKSTNLGFKVILVFQLTQHSRDEYLMKSLIEFFDCGGIYLRGALIDFKVSKLSDILTKIIPFFKEHPIEGVKFWDFQGFCRAAELMKQKKHLTKEGLEEIIKIKAGLNRGIKSNCSH